MNLRSLQKHWDSLATQDPLRAILARSEEKKNVPWDVEKFFQSGVFEIEAMLRYAESFRPLLQKKTALDFGCGVGRLTEALAAHFDRVCGVDISPAMIQHACSYQNSAGQHSAGRSEYIVNETGDLRLFAGGQFNFIYSSITLQHMPARFAKQYIAEFLRVLSPDGLLLFQLPGRRTGSFARVRSLAHELFLPLLHPITPRVVMRGIRKQEVVQLLGEYGGEVLDIAADESAGPEWESYRYLVKKASQSPATSPSSPGFRSQT
ncbi:MAG: methyltransferase domain-containing protein [Bryobacteraceae bacterium]